MFPIRDNEPAYARLRREPVSQVNRYGKSVETAAEGSALRGQSLNINGDPGIGANPDRYRQHGFFFNADNCIACHACESACSEKNDNPPHIAFRSVGFVEGGTYPAYQRLNISMACNHCDNPVCLKGCPTRAYTKFAEYGAVLQDPDICFGCGYCTWVCPYNAPQLDPVKGQVSKCNMCVDRLEVGLKPACVSACLGNALDFGVIENIPPGRMQAKASIPGFPRTDITHPNIRFQQTRLPQRDMHRVDSASIKYHRDDSKASYHPELDAKQGYQRHWNLRKLLGSHENAHIVFTLSTQAVMGAFLLALLGLWLDVPSAQNLSGSSWWLPFLGGLVGLMAFGLFKLNMHLGKPMRFYRGFNNWRFSPVSKEIIGVSAFFAGLCGFTFFQLISGVAGEMLAGLASLLALAGIAFGGYYMVRLYLIPARPFWNHWQTAASFVASLLTLGSSLIALWLMAAGQGGDDAMIPLSLVALVGLLLESAGLIAHRLDLAGAQSEGAASFYEQSTTFGRTYLARNLLLGFNLLLAAALASDVFSVDAWWLLALCALISAVLGRALFYVLVIPTTMPGAFFWRNKGFVEHARETGLADMPQLGVVYQRH